MAKYDLGKGDIFTLHAGDPGGGRGGPWHLPAAGRVGQDPLGGAYLTQCGERIAGATAELLRLPFVIGDMPDPAWMCRDCHF